MSTSPLKRLCYLPILLLGCSQPSEEQDPTTWEVEGDQGVLSFSLATDDAMAEGFHDFQLSVTGHEADLNVAGRLDMPAMTHGHVEVTVERRASGAFDLTDVELDMPGQWRLVLEASAGEVVVDTATITLEVH